MRVQTAELSSVDEQSERLGVVGAVHLLKMKLRLKLKLELKSKLKVRLKMLLWLSLAPLWLLSSYTTQHIAINV